MRNIWFILRRDLKRLIINPAAWVIIFGLTFIPALYAWFNIIGFWNPYGNTKGITVAVANEDAGADNAMMGKLELGDQIESTLKENHELGWTFLGKAKAMECVESGHCYAAIVIPRNFSENMAAVITGSGQRPTLEYYVNEKVNAVAPKMTDVGANTVDRQVNSAFVSTVSKAVTDTINTTNVQITQEGNATVAQTVAKLDATKANLSKSRTMIADLRKTLDGVDEKTTAAKQASTRPPQAPPKDSPAHPACSRKRRAVSPRSATTCPPNSTKAAICSCRRAARRAHRPPVSPTACSPQAGPPAAHSTNSPA